jgi:5-formyltetrahydrofolate cyclo-ligase
MAYDAMGHRLGRGKGYYDRFLLDLKDNYRIGICFPWQMVENLPVESHDMRVNEVLTAEM